MKSRKGTWGDRMSPERRKALEDAIVGVVRDNPGISGCGIDREVRKALHGYGSTSIGIAVERLIRSHRIERGEIAVPRQGFQHKLPGMREAA